MDFLLLLSAKCVWIGVLSKDGPSWRKTNHQRETFWKQEIVIHLCGYTLNVPPPQGFVLKVWFPVKWCDFPGVGVSGRCSGQERNTLEGHSSTQDPPLSLLQFPKKITVAPAHLCLMHPSYTGTSAWQPSLRPESSSWNTNGIEKDWSPEAVPSLPHTHHTVCTHTRIN